MLDFQKQREQDIQQVFFNTENRELVTRHRIGSVKDIGKPEAEHREYDVIVVRNSLTGRDLKDSIENIFLGGLLFYIPLESLGYRPKLDSTLIFDGEQYTVAECKLNSGVLGITLTSNRST